MRKTFVHILWGGLFTIIGLLVVAFVAVWNGWVGYMPDMYELQHPIEKYASFVYSADGKQLGTWSKDNRVYVEYNNLSPHLVHALVATEDERFYEHSGIDFIALARAVVKRGILGQTSAGGGSTITQQLAKQLYSEKAHSTVERLMQKPIEWIIAVKLEKNFTKEEIIAMYLNHFDFLHNAVGIKSAAETYFGKEPKHLTLDESAMLIGMCKNPSMYNPVKFRQRSLERRNVVLSQMVKSKYISQAECDEASSKSLESMKFKPIDRNQGFAFYFRDYVRDYMMAKKPVKSDYPSWNQRQYVLDSANWAEDPLYGWCNKHFKKNGDPYSVYNDGLRVYTTIDTRMQKYAEEAVYDDLSRRLQPAFRNDLAHKPYAPFTAKLSKAQIKTIMNSAVRRSHRYKVMKKAGASVEEIRKAFYTPVKMTVFTYNGEKEMTMSPIDSIKYYKSFLRASLVSIDPKTGHVLAYVGGQDYEHFQYDMAFVGRRQVGSTIKPYLYALAMENGSTPCTTILNQARSYNGFRPRGSKSMLGANVTLKWGLTTSNNNVSAYLIDQAGPAAFVDMLRKFGIYNPDIIPDYSLCLGSCDITVGEMCGAYTAFVNHGQRAAPIFVTKIEDSKGNTLATFSPRMYEVISAESSYKMLELLKSVVDRGTGRSLKGIAGIHGDVGGKTGTTNRNSDCWFMGVTPQLVTGCWVGGEERDIHFDSMAFGQGAKAALPIVGKFLRKVYSDSSLDYSASVKFDVPKDFDSCEKKDDVVNGDEIDEIYY